MDLSELLDEIKEIEIYNSDPNDWRGYLHSEDPLKLEEELVSNITQKHK